MCAQIHQVTEQNTYFSHKIAQNTLTTNKQHTPMGFLTDTKQSLRTVSYFRCSCAPRLFFFCTRRFRVSSTILFWHPPSYRTTCQQAFASKWRKLKRRDDFGLNTTHNHDSNSSPNQSPYLVSVLCVSGDRLYPGDVQVSLMMRSL